MSVLKHHIVWLIAIFSLLSSYDLFSPPITPTIWRQTHTAMETENFIKEGFSIFGLYTNLGDDHKYMHVLEFPIYNFVVGLLFMLFGNSYFWGKLVSYLCSCITVVIIYYLTKRLFGEKRAFYSSLFFVLFPIGYVVSTSFQPDAMSLMFLMCSLWFLLAWNTTYHISRLVLFLVFLLFSGLCKYPLIVPYLLLIGTALLTTSEKRFRWPKWYEVLAAFLIFFVPIVNWYIYRGFISEHDVGPGTYAMFLLGDLTRFFSISYYIRPLLVASIFVFCGVGCLFFVCGLSKPTTTEILLILGIPFFFVVIPTVSDQYYYFYSILPILSFIAAKGLMAFSDYAKKRKVVFALSPLIFIVYGLFFYFDYAYILRHDDIMYNAATELKTASKPADMIYSANFHNVNYGGTNPSMFYLSGRCGWDINNKDTSVRFTGSSDTLYSQAVEVMQKGARFFVITWYTPDSEPWFVKYLPVTIRNKLKKPHEIDGEKMFREMERKFEVKALGSNYAILDLERSVAQRSY